jgi:membrane dipeptidase
MDTLESRALELHKRSTIIDIHDHMFTPEDFKDMSQGGVTVKFCHLSVDEHIIKTSYWADSDQDPLVRFLKSLHYLYGVMEQAGGNIVVIRRAEDVTAAKRENRLGVLLGSEGGAFLKGSVELLQVFHHLGLRFVQLTWAYTNDLAAAQAETDLGKGLTPAGRKMVSEMCRLGIIIDLSHLSRRSIEDCFELSDKPMVFSHGHAFRESDFSGLDPEQMKKLILNRGIIGMHFCSHIVDSRFTGSYEKASIEDLLRKIDLALELGGEDCVALGPDYIPFTPYYLKTTNQEWLSYVEGLDNISRMSRLTDAMVRRGYGDRLIEKILGGNALRVIREVLG